MVSGYEEEIYLSGQGKYREASLAVDFF